MEGTGQKVSLLIVLSDCKTASPLQLWVAQGAWTQDKFFQRSMSSFHKLDETLNAAFHIWLRPVLHTRET